MYKTIEDLECAKELAMKWEAYFPIDPRYERFARSSRQKFIYSKSQLHIWQVESWIQDMFGKYEAVVRVSRWPTGSDKKSI